MAKVLDFKPLKPIPKHIQVRIRKEDMKRCPTQKGASRFYCYLDMRDGELVKITVAVRTFNGKWHCKQTAIHGVRSKKCYVRDMEYSLMGYRVCWSAEGYKRRNSHYSYNTYEGDGFWYDADFKYYNTYGTIVNLDYLKKLPQYKYSAYELYQGNCIICYLRLFEKYPQIEYLMKSGLCNLAYSTVILRRIGKDKKFCRWLLSHKKELQCGIYVQAIMTAYKTGEPIEKVQAFEVRKKLELHHTHGDFKPLRKVFKTDKELQQFFDYWEKHKKDHYMGYYLDYLTACLYLKLDMTRAKNRLPHNLKYWHDVRIDQYATAKAIAKAKENKADAKKAREIQKNFMKHFTSVATKYLALQDCKHGAYAVFIAKSPEELKHEGEVLNHCVGRLNFDHRMVREESLIFFVRPIDALDVPFVTIEYSPKSKKVLQCYGYQKSTSYADRCLPEQPVLDFVNNVWLPYANKTMRAIAA